MLKNITGLLLFEEKRFMVSSIRILAQKYIDNGTHPKDFNSGQLKNELAFEYSRRKRIDLKELIKKLKTNNILRLKHHLNIRSTGKDLQTIYDTLDDYNFTKLDNLHKFVLQLSNKKIHLKNPKPKSQKITMKVGPKRRTRRKKRKKT